MVPPTSRPMQHIDRKDLYTNLEARGLIPALLSRFLAQVRDFSQAIEYKNPSGNQRLFSQSDILNETRGHRSLDIELQIYQSAYFLLS